MQFVGNVARKTGDPTALALEAEKSRRAAIIGQETGLFYVPEVIRFDPVTSTLETERIHHLQSLLDLVVQRDPQIDVLCRRAGQALANVHASLQLPDELTKLPFPSSGEASIDNVVLHGDFNGANVCYDRRHDRLVIVDWSMAPGLPGIGTVGPRYLDIMWFVGFFFLQPWPSLGWRPRRWQRSTIMGYASEAGSHFDAGQFEAFRHDFSAEFLRVWSSNPLGPRARRHPVIHRQLRKLAWYWWENATLREVLP
jgi:hypothetical protein